MLSVTFALHTRDVGRRDTNTFLLTLDQVARSRADSCFCARIAVGSLFRNKLCDPLLDGCESLVSNVTQGSQSVDNSFCDLIPSTRIFDNWTCLHPLLEIGAADVHSSWII